MLLSILHEDADLLVVDKPAGLVCHPTKDGEMSSLIGRVRRHLGHGEGRLVNRLDRETSGIVLIAGRAATARELGKLFEAGGLDKIYLAVVHGHVAAATDSDLAIRARIGRDEESPVAIKERVRGDGAPAHTDVRTVRRFECNGRPFSLLEVRPRTGRKHQIRIHLAHIGHPLVGDKIYGTDERIYLRFVRGELTDEDRETLILSNHALHARTVAFAWRGQRWTFEAPLREELEEFVPCP